LKKLQEFHGRVGILYDVFKHEDNATQPATTMSHICTGDIYWKVPSGKHSVRLLQRNVEPGTYSRPGFY